MIKALLFVMLLPGALLFGASHFDEWSLRGPLPTTNEITDVVSGEGITVAVFGDVEGRILVSRDGRKFDLEEAGLPEGERLSELDYGNHRWLGCGNGKVWTKEWWQDEWMQTGDFPVEIVEVMVTSKFFWAWSGGYFSGTGRDRFWTGSRLYRSEDGVLWAEVTLTTAAEERLAISGMVESDARYVFTNSQYGGLSSNGIWVSGDGEEWHPMDTGQTTYTSVAYGNGLFMAGGSNGHVALSDDGENWRFEVFPYISHYLTTGFPGSGTPVYSPAREVTFYHGEFHVLTFGYSGFPLLAVSTDGVEWETQTWSDTYPSEFQRASITGLGKAGEYLYLMGNHGNLWRMSDWQLDREQLLPRVPWTWRAIAASDEIVVAMGEGGNYVWSEDAESFTHGVLPDAGEVHGLAWSGREFVAVGGVDGVARVWRSEDGKVWTSIEVGWLRASLNAVIWDGTNFILAGNGGRMAISADGHFWRSAGSETNRDLRKMDFQNGRYVVTTHDGFVRWSFDLQTWEERELGGGEIPLAYGNEVWMFSHGRPRLTSDFARWWKRSNGPTSGNLHFAFGHFLSIGVYGSLSVSADGTTWESYGDLYAGSSDEAWKNFRHLAVFQNRLVAVGDDGLISVSGVWRDLFAEWQQEQFTAVQMGNPQISGAHADPDQDGWSNALEYAFDSDPLVDEKETRASFGQMRTSLAGGFDSVYSYTGRIGVYRSPFAPKRPGVAVWIERTGDLSTWRRDDLIINSRQGWGGQRGQSESWIMLEGPRLNMLRLRAKVVRPD